MDATAAVCIMQLPCMTLMLGRCVTGVAQAEKPALTRLLEALEQGQAARTVPLADAERMAVRQLQLLTMKPLIYAMNVAEGDLGNRGAENPHVAAMQKQADKDNCGAVLVSAQVGVDGAAGPAAHTSPRHSCTHQGPRLHPTGHHIWLLRHAA